MMTTKTMTMTTVLTSDLPWSRSSSLSSNSVRSFAISRVILIRASSLKMPCLPFARSHSSASALLFFLSSARACFRFSFCSGRFRYSFWYSLASGRFRYSFWYSLASGRFRYSLRLSFTSGRLLCSFSHSLRAEREDSGLRLRCAISSLSRASRSSRCSLLSAARFSWCASRPVSSCLFFSDAWAPRHVLKRFLWFLLKDVIGSHVTLLCAPWRQKHGCSSKHLRGMPEVSQRLHETASRGSITR